MTDSEYPRYPKWAACPLEGSETGWIVKKKNTFILPWNDQEIFDGQQWVQAVFDSKEEAMKSAENARQRYHMIRRNRGIQQELIEERHKRDKCEVLE